MLALFDCSVGLRLFASPIAFMLDRIALAGGQFAHFSRWHVLLSLRYKWEGYKLRL